MKVHAPVVPLGSLCDFRGGATPAKRVREYWQGEIPWVSSRDVKTDVITDTSLHISQSGLDSCPCVLIPRDSVVMVFRSGVLTRTVPVALTGREVAINQDLKALLPRRDVLPRYLFYFLRSRMEQLLELASQGATVHRLDFAGVKSIGVPFPPLPEQQRIVAALDEAFEHVTAAEAALRRAELAPRTLTRAALEDHFLHALDRSTSTIGTVGTVFDGPHATPATVGEGPIFLGINALVDGDIDLRATRHVTEVDYAAWTRRVTPAPGDVVFSYETRLGQAAVVPPGLRCCLGRRMGLVRLKPELVDPWFFVYQYLSPPYQRYLETRTIRGATVDRLSIKEFPTFPVWVPPLAEQRVLVERIRAVQAEAQRLDALYRRKLAALDELKASLLHEVFSGNL